MSSLQNTECRKFRNPFLYKIDQLEKGYKNPNAILACKHFDN